MDKDVQGGETRSSAYAVRGVRWALRTNRRQERWWQLNPLGLETELIGQQDLGLHLRLFTNMKEGVDGLKASGNQRMSKMAVAEHGRENQAEKQDRSCTIVNSLGNN